MVPVRPNLSTLARNARAVGSDFSGAGAVAPVMAQLSPSIPKLAPIRPQFPAMAPMGGGRDRQGKQPAKDQGAGNNTFHLSHGDLLPNPF
jgi:hypothetical protein